jgi:hypothetical protein
MCLIRHILKGLVMKDTTSILFIREIKQEAWYLLKNKV